MVQQILFQFLSIVYIHEFTGDQPPADGVWFQPFVGKQYEVTVQAGIAGERNSGFALDLGEQFILVVHWEKMVADIGRICQKQIDLPVRFCYQKIPDPYLKTAAPELAGNFAVVRIQPNMRFSL